MEEFVNEIEKQIRTNFKVTAIPVETLKDFQKYCQIECGNVYWVGIYQLLETKKKYDNFFNLFIDLKKELAELKLAKKEVKIKTFGDE